MTETNTALTEAITKCDEIKARLETLREMSEPKPVLCVESVTTPVSIWTPRSADDLAACPYGTVIVLSTGRSYFRIGGTLGPWAACPGFRATSDDLWHTLTRAAERGITFKYFGDI